MTTSDYRIALLVFHWHGHFTHYAWLLHKALGSCGDITIVGPKEALHSEEFQMTFVNNPPKIEYAEGEEMEVVQQLICSKKYKLIFTNALDRYWHKLIPYLLLLKILRRHLTPISGILLSCGFAYPENNASSWKWLRCTLLKFVAPAFYKNIYLIDSVAFKLMRLKEGKTFKLLDDPIEEPPAATKEELRQRLNWDSKDMVLLAIGAIIPEKRIDLLIEAFLAMSPQPNQKLRIAGRFASGLYDAFTKLCKKSRCACNVILEDRWLSNVEITEYISAADFISVTYSKHFANASILFRAQKAGKPALVSDEGWIGRYAKQHDCGIFVNLNSKTEFSNSIRKLFNNEMPFVLPVLTSWHSEDKFVNKIGETTIV